MKKVLTILLITVTVFVCVLGFSGCRIKEEGKFYNLKEVYESGEISRQDLLSIMFYRYNYIVTENKDQYPEDFVPTPKDPTELDENTKKIMAYTYIKRNGYDERSNYRVDYYGKYGDYYAVIIAVFAPGTESIIDDPLYWTTIDGLGYYVGPYYNGPIILYKKD